MEPPNNTRMTKAQQATYHVNMQGANALADEFQIPRIESAELYDVFFRLRLDHPEIFWVTGYKYRYYKDSPNIIFIPEYLFDKGKVKEHQKAMKSRVEKLVRPAHCFFVWVFVFFVFVFFCLKKKFIYMILSVRLYITISLKRRIPMRSLVLWDRAWASVKALQKQ